MDHADPHSDHAICHAAIIKPLCSGRPADELTLRIVATIDSLNVGSPDHQKNSKLNVPLFRSPSSWSCPDMVSGQFYKEPDHGIG